MEFLMLLILLFTLSAVSNALDLTTLEPLVEEMIPCGYKRCSSFTQHCINFTKVCENCEAICHQKLGQENYESMDRHCAKVCPIYLERLRREKLQEEAATAVAAEAERLATTIQNIVPEPLKENEDSNDGLKDKEIVAIVLPVLVVILAFALALAFCIKRRLCDGKNILPMLNPQSCYIRRRNESTRSEMNDVTSQTSEGPSSLDHDQPTGATSQLLRKSPSQSAQPDVEQPLLHGSERPQLPSYRQQQDQQEPHASGPSGTTTCASTTAYPPPTTAASATTTYTPPTTYPPPTTAASASATTYPPAATVTYPPPTTTASASPTTPSAPPTAAAASTSPPEQEAPRAEEHQPPPIPQVPQTRPQQPHSLQLQRNQPEEALSNATNLTQNGKIVTRPSSDHQEQARAGAGAGSGARARSSPRGMREILRMSERPPPAALPPENQAETEKRNKQWVDATAAANDDDLSDLKMDDPDETSMPQTSQPEVSLTPSDPSFMPEDPLDLMESVSQVGAAARTPLPQVHGYNGASRQQGRGQGRGRGQGQGRGKR